MAPRSSALYLAILLLLVACEEPFVPVESAGRTFSIYGHLDAARDTQWVRVMPIRESLVTEEGPIDATVTLEEVETGTIVVMTGIPSRYPTVNLDGTVYAHNFYTTMPIVPGRHYRVAAARSDGAVSRATVSIPQWQSPTLVATYNYLFPTTPVVAHLNMMQGYADIRGTPHLALVLRQSFADCCEWRIPGTETFLPIMTPAVSEEGPHRVSMDPPTGRIEQGPPYILRPTIENPGPSRILVIASEEPWPFDPSIELRELGSTASINNVEVV